nr:MAG: hypothetical protein [Caudoviricetes sp.]
MPKKLTRDEFLEKAIAVHGKLYDYKKVNYVNYSTKVEIICIEHGSFFQTPERHLLGRGCNHKECLKVKREQTCLERYGVTVSSKSNLVVNKIKKTHAEKSEEEKKEILLKQQETCLERYDAKTPFQSKICNEKRKQTMTLKYGTEFALQNEECRNKSKESNKKTLLERYGVDHNFKIDGVVEKRKSSWLDIYGVENASQKHIPKETLDLLNNKEWLIDQHHNKEKSLSKISEELNIWGSLLGTYFKKHNIQLRKFKFSRQEKEIVDFLNDYASNIITFDRTILNGKELDAYLPDFNLAIEFNGLYWHSEKYRDETYHIGKTVDCSNKGIQLIHIFEDEWENKQEIVKSILLSKLGIYSKKIYARKCVVKQINSIKVRNFIEENHIQGNCPAIKYYSLWYDGEIVSALSINKSRFEKGKYEIVRYVTKCNTQIVGGFSKLLKRAKEDFGELYSYTDLRYFTGEIYRYSGTFIRRSKPGYFWTKGIIRISRYKTQKRNLSKILQNFDENETEIENMIKNGYVRIFDCGHDLFKL